MKTRVIRQLMLYGLLTLMLAAGYGLFISGLSLIFGRTLRADNPYLIGLIVFFLAFFLNPLRSWLQNSINHIFARNQLLFREQMQAFNKEISRTGKLQDIINLLRQYILDSLSPYEIHIYLYDFRRNHYYASPNQEKQPTSDLIFSFQDPLPQYLSQSNKTLFINTSKALPEVLEAEQSRLAVLGAELYIPLPGQSILIGWLALLSRQSGLPYSIRDIHYLENLAEQAAAGIEHAIIVGDLELRVHEMNVLTRLSQGINVTVTFDDTLELIYTHTNLLIPTKDFFITIHDDYSNNIYYTFFLENDERVTHLENQPIPYGQGLEREIIKNRNAVVTSDYQVECRNRGTLPAIRDVYAWIGVPLNAGAETIGAISLGSRDSNTFYSDEQANILQAIADQAAGAIVKTRLLQDAERRTKQLTALNDVARSISSTLALKPLLHQILQGAISIANCEAGNLFILDCHNQELVLEIVIGGDEKNLAGKRFPSNKGWEGKVVSARRGLILNDVSTTAEWEEVNEGNYDLSIRDLLFVPLLFQDEVTGLIKLCNRLDGLPFSLDDQELLTAFTSQAAAALENARLYTFTDQTLADRLEELSVMQRIDRELNASLDVNRAMRITLEWAMRQSQAAAGLIGMAVENSARIIASQGYDQELDSFNDIIPQIFLPIQTAFKTGLPQFSQFNDDGFQFILKDAISQIIIPIRRENDVIGIFMLENNQPGLFSEDSLEFLSRLSDHAAIAIANARLYTEVQAANQAKNEFISFISHELKTPMTSIRGYSDLLSSGLVGPVNDNQANFLYTIRSNVDRMATLVSDLADVSRIEAGRIRLEFSAVSLSEVVDEVVQSIQTQLTERNQEIEIQISEELPAMWGDRVRLIQIITNLISNAHKYTPPRGHIRITAELMEQNLVQGVTRVIHFLIKDDGYGIAPEHQKNIFQKFYRSEDQKVRDIPGTGLGLNISKQLVELLGGQIWFESIYGVGTTFHITIPIAEI